MIKIKQSKRKRAESEDDSSGSNFENEIKNKTKKRNVSKKKALVESASEAEADSSVTATNVESEDERRDENSDNDEKNSSISGDRLKQNDSKEINTLSDSSDDEPLASKKSNFSISEGCGCQTSDEDEPISKMLSSLHTAGKSKINASSDSSDDEPLAAKKTNKYSEGSRCQTSDEDEPIIKMVQNSQLNGKSKKVNHSSDSSDEKSPASSRKNSPEKLKINESCITSESEENRSDATSDDDNTDDDFKIKSNVTVKATKVQSSSDSSDDEPLSNKKSVKHKNGNTAVSEGKTKVKVQTSSDNSDDEPLVIKKSVKQKNSNAALSKGKPRKVQASSDSSDDEPLAIKKKAGNSGMSKEKSRKVETLSDSSDDEPLANKKSAKEKNGYVSPDEDEPLSKNVKTSSQKNSRIKEKNTTSDRIEHLKKYLRLSGIHINSYDKLFADCKSMKAKTEKLLSILHEKGMKGRPTLEKCKKLKKKIETKKEIAELDTSNIIKTEGRPKRGSGNKIPVIKNIENSPDQKRFSRLKNIIDSEESD